MFIAKGEGVMKKISVLMIVLSSLLFAANTKKNDIERRKRIEQQMIKQQLEKEKKYAREQAFYTEKDYDFKGAEVNPESLKSLPTIEVDDLDMDSVYD
jgi:uncharacterized membrane protein